MNDFRQEYEIDRPYIDMLNRENKDDRIFCYQYHIDQLIRELSEYNFRLPVDKSRGARIMSDSETPVWVNAKWDFRKNIVRLKITNGDLCALGVRNYREFIQKQDLSAGFPSWIYPILDLAVEHGLIPGGCIPVAGMFGMAESCWYITLLHPNFDRVQEGAQSPIIRLGREFLPLSDKDKDFIWRCHTCKKPFVPNQPVFANRRLPEPRFFCSIECIDNNDLEE